MAENESGWQPSKRLQKLAEDRGQTIPGFERPLPDPVVGGKYEKVELSDDEAKRIREAIKKEEEIVNSLELVLSEVKDRPADYGTKYPMSVEVLDSNRINVNAYIKDSVEGSEDVGKRKKELLRIVNKMRGGGELDEDEKNIASRVGLKSGYFIRNRGEEIASIAEEVVSGESEKKAEKKSATTESLKVETPDQENEQRIQQYLDAVLSTQKGPDRSDLLRKWLDKYGTSYDPDQVRRVMNELGAAEVERPKIPTEPIAFRKFIRKEIRGVISKATNENQLSVQAIEDKLKEKLMGELGADPAQGFRFSLFPKELGDDREREEIIALVETEIEARANLRTIQIKEEGYKSNTDRNAALQKYISDMKGTEGSTASPSVISKGTYDWLKSLDGLGDPNEVTTEKVDKALSTLLKLGEGRFTDPEMGKFARYEDDENNFYSIDYNPTRRESGLALIATEYGKDAFDLAYQIFQAYKEEGNYNKKHYLFSLFKFSEARVNATKATPSGFIGSKRIYTNRGEDRNNDPDQTYQADFINNGRKRKRSYANEIKLLALSALRVETCIAEIDPRNNKHKTKAGVYFEKALEGKFLQDTNLTDPEWVEDPPEIAAFSGIKSGEKIKAAIEGIGKLGVEEDKNRAIQKAETYLSDIRTNGESLVDAKVLRQEDLEDQLYTEAKNVLWELSISNPINGRDLSRQTREKPKFLLVQGLTELMLTFGGKAGNTDLKIIENRNHYNDLRSRVQILRKYTLQEFEKGPDEGGISYGENDIKIVQRERNTLNAIDLPTEPGKGLIRKTTDKTLKAFEIASSPIDLFQKEVLSKIPGPIGRYYKTHRPV